MIYTTNAEKPSIKKSRIQLISEAGENNHHDEARIAAIVALKVFKEDQKKLRLPK